MTQESLRTVIALAAKDITYIKESLERVEAGLNTHIGDDKAELISIRKEIKEMNKYAASIALVSGCIGAGLTYLKQKIIG